MLALLQALNALSTQVMHEVVAALEGLEQDATTRVAVLTGRGKAFAAGADIKEMQTLTQAQVRPMPLLCRVAGAGCCTGSKCTGGLAKCRHCRRPCAIHCCALH